MKKFTYAKLRAFSLLLILMCLTLIPFAQPTSPYPMHWVNQVESTSWEYYSAVATDNTGNSYLIGRFDASTATFGSVTLSKSTLYGDELFIAKYGSDGSLIWVKQAGDSRYCAGYGIATDPNGNIFVTGEYGSSITFGPGEPNETELTPIVDNFGYDIFIAKFNTDGYLQWAKRAGGAYSDGGYAIATDNAGNCYFTGYVGGEIPRLGGLTVTFGIDDLTQIDIDVNGRDNIFVAKYDADGNVVWAKKAEGYTQIENTCTGVLYDYPGYDYGRGIAVTSDNHCLITGEFNYGVTFGPGETNETLLVATSYTACGLYNNDNFDMFIAKYDGGDGSLMWAKSDDCDFLSSGWGVATDNNNYALVTGFFSGSATFGTGEANETTLNTSYDDIFIAKYDEDGELIWARQDGGGGVDDRSDWGYGITTDQYNNFFVTGTIGGTAIFGVGQENETELTSSGLGDIFIAKYNHEGELFWVKKEGGVGDDQGHGIALDDEGNIFINGSFRNDVIFASGEPNQTNLITVPVNWYDYFIMKLEAPASLILVDFDIHPTSWPNPINVNSGGLVPCAILGTDELDVTTIDPTSLTLEGVSPIRWSYEDVTGPVDGESECNETVQGPDGYLDLTLKFKNQELISSLGEVSDGDELILTIVGNLMDDQEIEGNDCVIIIDNTKSEEISSTDLPTIFALEQNYPNPFYSTSVINFSIPEDCHVELQFMDMTGKIIYTIENRKYEAGYHSVVIDAMDLEQGLYFYRIVAGEYTDTKQALIIK